MFSSRFRRLEVFGVLVAFNHVDRVALTEAFVRWTTDPTPPAAVLSWPDAVTGLPRDDVGAMNSALAKDTSSKRRRLEGRGGLFRGCYRALVTPGTAIG